RGQRGPRMTGQRSKCMANSMIIKRENERNGAPDGVVLIELIRRRLTSAFCTLNSRSAVLTSYFNVAIANATLNWTPLQGSTVHDHSFTPGCNPGLFVFNPLAGIVQ